MADDENILEEDEERIYYTVEEANKLLPKLIPVLKDLEMAFLDMEDKREAYETEHTKVANNGGHFGEGQHRVAREAFDKANGKFDRLSDAIEEYGIVIKGMEPPLIDFFSQRDDEDIFLCFKLGEEKIEYWHDLESGFAGRQPL